MSEYIDLHVLQTVPPSCINRDDTGSPKTAVYGGVVRARVSSQAWKHSMRAMFPGLLSEGQLGKRTKRVVSMVTEQIEKLAQEENIQVSDAEKRASDILTTAGLKLKGAESEALFFLSEGQARALAELTFDETLSKDKNVVKEALNGKPSVDLALFGRMVASDPSLNYDAAAQVSHAISTHGVHTEYDYFTAVDDCSGEDSAGAGHIGTVEFVSSTMYRYATLNLSALKENIGDDMKAAVSAFVRAFIRSMPTGKQNTFANRTLPDMVYVTVRSDQPINLSGAFERAVRGDKDGYVAASKEQLARYAEEVYANYASRPDEAFVIGGDINDAKHVSEPELIREIERIAETFTKTTGGVDHVNAAT